MQDPRTYPWDRPRGSYRLEPATGEHRPLRTDETVELLAGRWPRLAVGSNAAPSRLTEKLRRREAVDPLAVVAVDVADHDAAFAAYQASYGAVPATIAPSVGTRLRTHLVLVTEAQRIALDDSEGVPDTYVHVAVAPGVVTPVDVDVDLSSHPEVLAYRATAGTLCVDGTPRALAVLAAEGRRWTAWSEHDVLAWIGSQLGRSADEVADGRVPREAVARVLARHRCR